MKRTKQWWSRLTKGERIELMSLEQDQYHGGGSAYIPDDCSECGHCSTPHLGYGLCPICNNRLGELIDKAFISTPHIAGYSTDGKANGTSMVVNSLCRFFNLPLSNWYPGNVPDPANPIISIDCNGKNDEEVLRRAVYHTYNIDEDNIRLRLFPSEFEKQRGDYPLRREFTAYRVILKGGTRQTRIMLKELGFKVV